MNIIDIKFQMAAFAVSIALVGCTRETGSTSVQNGPSEPNQTNVSEAVRQELKETTQALGDSAAKIHQEAVATIENQLRDMDAQLAKWQSNLAGLKDDAKSATETALESLRQKRQALDKPLEQLKAATAETWQEAKSSFDKLMEDLQKSFADLKTRTS